MMKTANRSTKRSDAKSSVGSSLTSRYHILDYQIEGMINFRDKKAKQSRERVIHALEELKKATSEQICNFLQKETEENNQRYEQEKKDETFVKNYLSQHSKPATTIPEVLDTIYLRTVQRRLNELKKEGVVQHVENDQYLLSKLARSDIRYFPKNFRDLALSDAMYIKKSRSYEESLNSLVQVFGTYVIYCFIESVKTNVTDDSNLSLYWLQDALSPFNLYLSFLSAFRNGNDKKGELPHVSNETLKMLTQVLKNNYSLYYERLLKIKEDCLLRRHKD